MDRGRAMKARVKVITAQNSTKADHGPQKCSKPLERLAPAIFW